MLKTQQINDQSQRERELLQLLLGKQYPNLQVLVMVGLFDTGSSHVVVLLTKW